MAKSTYICERCNRNISRFVRYRVYIHKFSGYGRKYNLLKTIDLCDRCYKATNIEIVEKVKKKENKKVEEKNTYILNPIKNTIRKSTWNNPMRLTERESRFLAVLSNSYLNTWEDMNDYIYKDKATYKYAPGCIKQSLLDKIDIHVRTVHKMRICIRR